MSTTLYHYVHCPFCIRIRMACGHLNIRYKSVVVPYHDEQTPLRLTGKKMLPIWEDETGARNESLEIIEYLDHQKLLKVSEVTSSADFAAFEELLAKIGNPVHSLAMPYWIFTPEFDQESRIYFQKKKEVKRGPFKDLVKNQETFIKELSGLLENVEKSLKPFYNSSNFTLYDILLAAHLWGLYIVPEFQFSEKMHQYLQSVKEKCGFSYHEDYWS